MGLFDRLKKGKDTNSKEKNEKNTNQGMSETTYKLGENFEVRLNTVLNGSDAKNLASTLAQTQKKIFELDISAEKDEEYLRRSQGKGIETPKDANLAEHRQEDDGYSDQGIGDELDDLVARRAALIKETKEQVEKGKSLDTEIGEVEEERRSLRQSKQSLRDDDYT